MPLEVKGVEKIVTLSSILSDIREEVRRNRAELDLLRKPSSTAAKGKIRAEQLFGPTESDDGSTPVDEQ